jgi:hypothetical protein
MVIVRVVARANGKMGRMEERIVKMFIVSRSR